MGPILARLFWNAVAGQSNSKRAHPSPAQAGSGHARVNDASDDRLGMRGASAPGGTAGADQRFIHDFADGASATAALRAAAEAAVNLTGAARRGSAYHGAHFVVTQDVAGANDHGHGFRCQTDFK